MTERALEKTDGAASVVRLGQHRILLGDARRAAHVQKLFGRSRAALVVTSPPYFNQRAYCSWQHYDDYLLDIERVAAAILRVAAEPFACCWNVGDSVKDHRDIPADHSLIFRKRGFCYRDKIAWIKPSPLYSVPRYRHIDRGRYFPALQWETVLVFTLGGLPTFEQEDIPFWKSNVSNVWKIPPVAGSAQKKIGHPAIFPEELAARCIRAYSRKGDIVFDPFLGSGTTLLAAAQLGRRCFGMDIRPDYVNLAVDRFRRTRPAPRARAASTPTARRGTLARI